MFCLDSSYNTIKTWYQGGNAKIHLGPTLHMIAAAEAGILTLVITNPIWVVKTRLCLQFESGVSQVQSDPHRYKGMVDAFVKTYRYEGVRGLYKGFVPGVFGVSHGALQFMAYEELKAQYNRSQLFEYLTFAALSKLFAAVTTYPYQVLRARMQDQHSHYVNLRHCVKETFRYEGITGFYKGMTPYLLHVMPNICLVFLIYETVSGGRM
ncbi:putative mitochondrial carrier C27B12.09c [Armadillidium vulgare]|nr:putative mitochondrial carrier C27B12.09c [Armadillidium vulgare]